MRPAIYLALLVFVFAGCDDAKAPKPTAAAQAGASASAATGGLCPEHGIAEAICTKCNPKLIPIFQAKGDWCDEHGFPESACPICHPERGGQPAVGIADDGAPPDGAKVCLATKDSARMAGIETVKAEERPEGAGLVVTATISFDATRRAIVNARSPGVVRSIKADIGAKVAQGQPLAVIHSAEVGADRSRIPAARSRVQVAEANYRREKDLYDKGIASGKDVLAAQQEWDAAKSESASLTASLGAVGKGAGGTGGYTLTAPVAGQVVRREATIGKLVGLEETLFEIVDTSTMWAELDIPEDEIPFVQIGQLVIVTVDGLGDRQFRGKIDYVAPEVDPRTRTVEARVALANPDGLLRANMFASARIALGGDRATVTVPAISVQSVRKVPFVFVRLDESDFQVRRVALGATEGAVVELVKGVKPNEDVVAQGSFLLKTETLKDSIGDGCTDD
jgi:cobalt-zinc-cadmium efflux system membrane fusion protein